MIMRIYAGILSALLVQVGFAMEEVPQNLNELLTKVKGLNGAKDVPHVMEHIKIHNQSLLQQICQEVMAENFYEKASKAEVGTIKSRAMVTYCSGTTFERADLKKATQKEKHAATGHEQVQLKHRESAPTKSAEPSAHALPKVQLRHVEIKSGGNFEQQKANLLEAEKEMRENMEILGKKKEFEAKKHELVVKLEEANKKVKEAQDFYDNLSIMILGMREDLSSGGVKSQLKVFKPGNHENDTPEDYLKAAKQDLPLENVKGFDRELQSTFPGFLLQLPIAENLLTQANKHLAEGRRDLEGINRELLALVENK
jgi:hypothetical protein